MLQLQTLFGVDCLEDTPVSTWSRPGGFKLQRPVERHSKSSIQAQEGAKRKNMSNTAKFPVPYKQLTTTIKGIKTDLVLCSYDDHILVMASQIGTVGTMLHARKEEGFATNPIFNVSVLFGKRDEPMLVACARQLIENISKAGSSRPLVISIGLKDHSVETLKAIIEVVIENKVW